MITGKLCEVGCSIIH